MPLRPEDLDFMQSYLSGAPREDLQKRLDGMYGPVTPEMQQQAFAPQPDARTAGNAAPAFGFQYDPSQLKPVVVTATDAAPPPMGAIAASRGPAPVAKAPAPAEAPTPAPATPAQAAPGAPVQAFDPVAEMIANQMTKQLAGSGGPSKVVPGGEQLDARTVSRELHGKLSPETSEELEAANIDAQGLAVGQGEAAAQQIEKQARLQAQQAQSARVDLASYKRTNAAKQAEYDIRRSELDDMRAQIEKEPATYWSGKGVGTRLLNAIGLIMLGLDKNQGAAAIQNIVNSEVERKQKERGTALNLLQDQLNRFKEGIPNPEAQALYTRSLGLDAAAAETARLASIAKAEDVRQRGFAAAEQLRMEALKAKAGAETSLLGKEEIKTKNVAPKVVGGGRAPMTIDQVAAKWKKTPEEVAEYIITHQRPGGALGGAPKNEFELAIQKDANSRRVAVPGTNISVWTDRDADAKELYSNLQAQQNLSDSFQRLREFVSTPGRKIDPATWEKIKAETAGNLLTVAQSKGQGAVGEGEAKRLGVLAGAIAENWTTPEKVSVEVLEHTLQVMQSQRANSLSTTYSDPYSHQRYKPGASAGTGGAELGFTEFK